MGNDGSLILHATSVAVGQKGVVITGASGAGKSALALEMMTRGALLVADDRVILTKTRDAVRLTCPDPLLGRIEARGIGLLYADYERQAELALVVDLDKAETARMPPNRSITYLTKTFPLLHNVASQHFPAALIQYLRSSEPSSAQT